MQYQHYNLRSLNAGQVVEISLSGNAANVKLMDANNFHSYKSGRQHRYYGGYVTSSLTRLDVPFSGSWHLAIDLGGRSGSVRSSVRVY
ncbi:DUF1883 domain-containing protein [Proteus terrae]|uniref:DUF1883 domain-containing protein n=1 Tax=Proteus terrae TaxID=1574161 RepID=UPI0034D40C75